MANVINAVGEYTPVCLRNEFSSEPVRRKKNIAMPLFLLARFFIMFYDYVSLQLKKYWNVHCLEDMADFSSLFILSRNCSQ